MATFGRYYSKAASWGLAVNLSYDEEELQIQDLDIKTVLSLMGKLTSFPKADYF